MDINELMQKLPEYIQEVDDLYKNFDSNNLEQIVTDYNTLVGDYNDVNSDVHAGTYGTNFTPDQSQKYVSLMANFASSLDTLAAKLKPYLEPTEGGRRRKSRKSRKGKAKKTRKNK